MQTQTSKEQDRLTQSDHARLMLNTSDVANRYVRLKGKSYPILHLGIGKMAVFKAEFEWVERLYQEFVQSKKTLSDFLFTYRDELYELLVDHLPKAAAAILNTTEDRAKALGTPLELLNLVLSQWVHNLEIIRLKTLYPHPEDSDEPEDETDNPLAVVERLMAAYNGMTYEAAVAHSVPQIYLMGQNSAVAYKKLEEKTGTDKKGKPAVGKKDRRGIYFEDQWWKNPKAMGAERYKRYLGLNMQAAMQGKKGNFAPIS